MFWLVDAQSKDPSPHQGERSDSLDPRQATLRSVSQYVLVMFAGGQSSSIRPTSPLGSTKETVVMSDGSFNTKATL